MKELGSIATTTEDQKFAVGKGGLPPLMSYSYQSEF